MEMKTVLARIDLRLAALGTTDAAVSKKATGSQDTVRNWRRRVAKGESPSASVSKIEAISEVLGVTPEWLQGQGPEDLDAARKEEAEIRRLIDLYRSLEPDLRPVAINRVSALVPPESQSPAFDRQKKDDEPTP
jgi:transcriptional regulator with XRE-family HTH domain